MNVPLESADQIRIDELELFGRVGVTDQERVKSQRLVVNIVLWPSQQAEQLRDAIKRAVNYTEVGSVVRDFVKEQTFALLETMAAELAATLLDSFTVRAVRVEVRKFVLPDAKHVAVVVTRFAQNA